MSCLKAMPTPLKSSKSSKMKIPVFLHKWVQICLKLIKIVNLALKVGFMGQKMTIKFRKVMSADAIFGLF